MADAMREALKACRPEIERQRDRCNSDQEVGPYQALLDQVDAALAPQPALEPRKKCRCHLMDNSCEVHWPFPDCPWCGGKNGEHAIICRSPPQPTSVKAAPSPALDPATVEACSRELERLYPDHTWVNAYCAAIRALLASPAPSGDLSTRIDKFLQELREEKAARHGQAAPSGEPDPMKSRAWSLAIHEAARTVEVHAQEMRNMNITITADGLSAIGKAILKFADAAPCASKAVSSTHQSGGE